MDFVSMDDVTRNKYHLLPKEKINGVRKHGGCDSIHDITYPLRGKEMLFIRMEDVIKNTISLTRYRKNKWSS